MRHQHPETQDIRPETINYYLRESRRLRSLAVWHWLGKANSASQRAAKHWPLPALLLSSAALIVAIA